MGSGHADAAGDVDIGGRLQAVGIALLIGAAGYLFVQAASTVGLGFLGYALGMPIVAGGYLLASGQDRSFVDVTIPSLRDLGYVVGGFVGLLALLIVLSQAYQLIGTTPAEHGIQDSASQDPRLLLYLIPIAIFLIGPYEELIYRNLVQKHLYRVFSRRNAILVASGIFALFHYQAYATGSVTSLVVALVTVFALSLVLGWLYARTDNVVVPALVHGVYNALVFGALYVNLTGGI
ncbi:MAG: CPBP family intramembrane glutamic endopeptidase [Salinarchaeum sp.]